MAKLEVQMKVKKGVGEKRGKGGEERENKVYISKEWML